MQENKEKKLIKDQITFTTSINNQKITINGEDLVGRSEERLKKKTK
jgi:RNase P/RNase MRP subunit p29